MKLPFDSCILDACKGCVKHLLLSAVLDGKGGKKWLWGFLQNQIIASENLQENCLFFFLTSIFPFMQGKKKTGSRTISAGFWLPLYFMQRESRCAATTAKWLKVGVQSWE